MPASFGGIGTDFNNVIQVIHVGPPKTKELTLQYAGRCRGAGTVLFLLTWQQHCANLYHTMVAIASRDSDAETVEEANMQRDDINATTATLLYPVGCLRQLLEEPFLPPDTTPCRTCRQIHEPLCSGCNLNEKQSLLHEFREQLLPWYESNNANIQTAQKNFTILEKKLDWSAVVNNSDHSPLLLVNDNCLKDFLVEHGVTPKGVKADHAKSVYDLCCPKRFNDHQMMRHVEQVVKAGDMKQMKEVVSQLSARAKVPEYQAQEVIQRLLVHRILDNEPPGGALNVKSATTETALGLWRVGRGKCFTTTRIPPLQPTARTQMKVSRRNKKRRKTTGTGR
jgi:superfamily II DNA helicase RecQ